MKRFSLISLPVVLALLAAQLSFVTGALAEPATFNDPNFQIVWERTDKPVEMFTTARSYMWGPDTLPGSPSTEPYANSPGGNRTVQYFDKSRMEVNNPNGDRSQLFFVTNGLLVREMVSGNRQFGDTSFQFFPPAQEAVAGDPATVNPNSPTYATFKNIASLNNDNPSPDRTGQAVTESIDKAGTITTITSPDPSVSYVSFNQNLKHNMPNKFVDFLNQTGPVFVNGQIVQDTVINGVFLAGFPITEAFWVKAKVAGVEKDVLVQLYERRVLTYTPSNPAGFQVEMGNVGQHYFRWRYGTTPPPPLTEERIVFQLNGTTGTHIWSMKTDGTDMKQLTTMGDNLTPRWSPDNSQIVFVSARVGDNAEEIYVMNSDGTNQKRLTNSTEQNANPDFSGDGSRIFFERGTGGVFDIWSMAADGSDQKQLTTGNGAFTNEMPRSSPDGNKVAFASTRDGLTEVYTMNADGSNVQRLTNRQQPMGPHTGPPTDWKGNTILFQVSDLHDEIWSMDSSGANQVMVSPTSTDGDHEGSFSPDAKNIVFVRDTLSLTGLAHNIWIMKADGSSAENITKMDQIYRLPDWSN